MKLLVVLAVSVTVSQCFQDLQLTQYRFSSGNTGCLIQCTGSTDRGTLTWTDDGDFVQTETPGDTTQWENIYTGYNYGASNNYKDNYIRIIIDTSKCGFTGIPVVISTLDVNSGVLPEDFNELPGSALIQGSTAVTDVTSNSFTVHLLGWITGRTDMEANIRSIRPFFGINWRAYGHVC